MRVLALVTDAYGGRGGIAQAARDVICTLAMRDTISTIDVLPRHAPDPVGVLPAKVCQRPPTPGRLSYAAHALAAARPRPDFVFCNHLFMAPLAAAVARLVGARLIIQLHGVEISPPPRLVRRRALEAADLLLCVSRDTRARVLAHAGIAPERAVVLNNTIGDEFTPGDRAAARGKFGLENEAVILSVGRLDSRERYKGHDRIIAALPKLAPRDGRSALYLIAGDGDDRSRLERIAKEVGVWTSVRFLGRVSPQDLPDLYRAADLFALPSTGEGFGIVFTEAMACGTPALGIAAGGAPDALGDGQLGALSSLSEFPSYLGTALEYSPLTPQKLALAVRARFGREAFAAHLNGIWSRLECRD